MSTTPALARATETLIDRSDAYDPDEVVARKVVSAALDHPSVADRVHDALYTVPADDLLDKQPGETYHDHAKRVAAWAVGAVSAAILGEA